VAWATEARFVKEGVTIWQSLIMLSSLAQSVLLEGEAGGCGGGGGGAV